MCAVCSTKFFTKYVVSSSDAMALISDYFTLTDTLTHTLTNATKHT